LEVDVVEVEGMKVFIYPPPYGAYIWSGHEMCKFIPAIAT